MADIELVIKIPQFLYKHILKCHVTKKTIAYIFKNALPLEKHDAEVIKETVENIWGKPPYTEALDDYINELIDKCMETLFDATLDKIRAEIEQYQADCDLSCSDDANCRTCDNITFGCIYQIIDKYRKGDKE